MTSATAAGHDNKSYELIGGAALDLSEVADMVSSVWEKPIAACDMDSDAYRYVLAKRGLPAFAIDAQVGIRMAAGAGEYCEVTPDAVEPRRPAAGELCRLSVALTQGW